MLPHLVLIEQAMSRLLSMCKHCGKGNCEKAAVSSRGGQVWLRYLVRGTDYSAMDSPGGPLSRGDCPWCDKYTEFSESGKFHEWQ